MTEDLTYLMDVMVKMLGEENSAIVLHTFLDCLNRFVGDANEKDLHTIEIILDGRYGAKYTFDEVTPTTPKA